MPVAYAGTAQDGTVFPLGPGLFLLLHGHSYIYKFMPHSNLSSETLNPSFHGSRNNDTHGPDILNMDPQSSCLYFLLKPASYPAPPIPASAFSPTTLQSGKGAMQRSFTTPISRSQGLSPRVAATASQYLYFSLFSFPHLGHPWLCVHAMSLGILNSGLLTLGKCSALSSISAHLVFRNILAKDATFLGLLPSCGHIQTLSTLSTSLFS